MKSDACWAAETMLSSTSPPSDDAYRKPQQQAGLSDSRVSDQEELQAKKRFRACAVQMQAA